VSSSDVRVVATAFSSSDESGANQTSPATILNALKEYSFISQETGLEFVNLHRVQEVLEKQSATPHAEVRLSLDECAGAIQECDMVNEQESATSSMDAERYAKAILDSLISQGVRISYE
jgi:hypothetical protein